MKFEDFFPIWNQLTDAQKTSLSGGTLRRSVKKGSILHSGNEDCTGLLLVEHGRLRAYIVSDEGREITLYRLLSLDICLFSASCMLRSLQFEVIIDAEQDTALWVIPADTYNSVMSQSAALANFTNELMSARFSEVMWLMEQILWKSFDKRLARFLLDESALTGTDTLKLTHEAIGNHMGHPREVVTRMLGYFQNEGMVRLGRGTVELVDKKKLSAQT